MRRIFSRATQGATACLPAVASAEAGAAVDQKHDGWEAVTPWVFALTLLLFSLDPSAAVAAPLSADMIVSVPDQVLALVDRALLNFDFEVRNRRFCCQLSHAAWHAVRFSKNRRPFAFRRGHQESHSDR